MLENKEGCNDPKIVFVGAGLSTLIVSLYLINKGFKGSNIVIIERAPQVGGQYTSIRDSEKVFDLGMHIYYETGVKEIDNCFINILSKDEWIYLEDNKKDIAGIYWNGNLQTNSPYPDLRSSRILTIRALLSICGVFLRANRRSNKGNAQSQLRNHFGKFLEQKIFSPILSKLYGVSADSLDKVALKLTAMNRVVLFNASTTLKFMKVKFFRKRIAFPSQLELPKIRKNYGRGIYPRIFGFDLVIKRIEETLINCGVTIHTNTIVKKVSISPDGMRICGLTLEDNCNNEIDIQADELFWMIVPIKLPKELNLNEKNTFPLELHRGKKVFINVLLKQVDKLKGLYYFYMFDDTSNIFRVTNYFAYCPDAIRHNKGLFPLTIEYWASKIMDSEELLYAVQRDLVSMQICNEEDIALIEIANRDNEFPTPTIEALDFVKARYKTLNAKFENVKFCGTFSDSENFFLHENLKVAFNVVKERVNK